jgi:hypothetical protein
MLAIMPTVKRICKEKLGGNFSPKFFPFGGAPFQAFGIPKEMPSTPLKSI